MLFYYILQKEEFFVKNKKLTLTTAVLLSLLLVVSGIGFAQGLPNELPRDKTVYVAGEQWGPIESFNPLGGADWPVQSADMDTNLIYEHLFTFNMLSGELDPLLAESYEWIDDLTVEVKLNDKAKWNDGDPVTAEDVVYSFRLGDEYNLLYSNMWQYTEKVFSPEEGIVRIKMKADNPNPFIIEEKLCQTFILPKDEVTKIEEKYDHNLAKIRSNWTNENPVASGPYNVAGYSAQRVVIERDDNYWGIEEWGKPAPQYIVHPIFKSNGAGNRAFKNAEVDISQQFLPQVWNTWLKNDKPVKTWFDEQPYHLPYQMPSLFMNLHEKPMSDPAFREALAHAINYEKIAQLAMTKYSETMQPGLLLPYEPEKQYLDKEDQEKYGWKYNPEKAKEILEEAGYTKGPNGWYQTPDGEEISLTATCPYGWTDWNVSLKIVAQNAREIGLNIKTNFPEYPAWQEDLQRGDFELTMEQAGPGTTPANPWRKFQMAMGSADLPEMGEVAYHNYGRYRNDEANEIIDEIPKMSKEEQAEAYKELNRIFMQDIPIIPLEYRPGYFYEVNETHWKGFPDSDNPYAPPMTPFTHSAIKILYQIEPVEK